MLSMKNTLPHISNQTARRYLLGKQGLWPGRRLQGKQGAATAIRTLEKVQVDSVSAVARNHDLILWSRVLDYHTAHLDELMFTDRLFFDWGGCLHIYPIEDLPHLRIVMLGRRSHEDWARHIATHTEAIEFVRRELQERGPLGNRDFTGEKRFVGYYRSEKETGQALYSMWQLGELMTHSRKGFDRIYYFANDILDTSIHGTMPPLTSESIEMRDEDISSIEHHLALKTVRDIGLGPIRLGSIPGRSFTTVLRTKGNSKTRAILDTLTKEGSIALVNIEGLKDTYFIPAADLPLLDILEQGNIPDQWQPLDTTTLEEVNFLAPLDNLIWDRARLKALFDFEYLWEVYKPPHTRKYGPYTMPILYGDRLVGRLNPKLDRKTKVLKIDGFWLEDESMAKDKQFRVALSAGLKRFAAFHEAEIVELSGIGDASLRKSLI